MGGINATETFAVLLLPVLWFLTRRPLRAHARLFALWALAVAAAVLWFVIPLLLEGRYGFDFLPYTERASATLGNTFVPEVLRGAGIWTSFGGTPPLSTAGILIESAPAVIVASSTAAAAGLFGLAHRDMPERRWLGLAVVVGTVLVCAGYWGHLGGPFAPEVHRLYDGPLSAFRNVYKFQPVITLPLVLGLIHAVSAGTRAYRRVTRARRNLLVALLAAGVLAVVGVSAAPLPTGRIYPEGSFTATPAYWQHAVSWLNARGGTSTTVVLPGTNFGYFTWGNPLDQPIETLATVPWAERSIMPYGSVGNIQYLDAIDQVLAGGQPVPGLAAYLARAGVRYVLVENDLNPADTQSPPPVVLRQVLAQEPGLVRVAHFGPLVHQVDSGFGLEAVYDPNGVTRAIHALEVYRIVPAAGHDDRVTTYPSSSGVVLSGGPQGVLAAADAGLLRGEAMSLAGDPLAPRFARPIWVDADTQQLRDTQYTTLYANQSSLLAPGQTSQSGSPPDQWIVVPGARHETTVKLHGAAQITASSFGPIFNEAPGQQPLEAFLADARQVGAAWQASPDDPRPWIEIRFDQAVPLSRIRLTPLVGRLQTAVTKVQITTARGQVTDPLARAVTPQEFVTPAGDSRWLRVTLVGLRNPPATASPAGPGLAHIAIPGISVSQSWIAPADGPATPGAVPTYLFSSPVPNQFAFFKVADDEAHLSRQFRVPHAAVFAVSGQAAPLESPLLGAGQLSLGTTPVPSSDQQLSFSVPCGSGPAISIDGRAYATSVQGTNGELYSLRPMALTLCTVDGAVRLGAGIHTVTADNVNSGYKVTGLELAGTGPSVGTARPVTVTQWRNDARALTVAAGPSAIINVHENYNPGWVATVGDHQLRAVRLDGWQQGWVLPAADASEQVTLRFVPESSFREGLVIGAVIALALVGWALLSIRRPKNRHGPRSTASRRDESTSSESVHLAPASAGRVRPRLQIGILTGATTLIIFALAGPAAVVVPVCVGLGLLARRRRNALAWVAGGSAMLAGIAIAVHPGYRMGELAGSGSYTAQALGALALAALAVSLFPAFDTSDEV
jgi:arabinofuranan 3-O-arabinosyltransferase